MGIVIRWNLPFPILFHLLLAFYSSIGICTLPQYSQLWQCSAHRRTTVDFDGHGLPGMAINPTSMTTTMKNSIATTGTSASLTPCMERAKVLTDIQSLREAKRIMRHSSTARKSRKLTELPLSECSQVRKTGGPRFRVEQVL